MKTTLNEIKSHHPCGDGWALLLKTLGKTKADDEPLDLMAILNSNGIEDAVWALKCFDAIDTCLFNADVAESVLHIFETYNNSQVPRLTIRSISDFKARKITKKELLNQANLASIHTDSLYLTNGPRSAAQSAIFAARLFSTASPTVDAAVNAHAFYTSFGSAAFPNGTPHFGETK